MVFDRRYRRILQCKNKEKQIRFTKKTYRHSYTMNKHLHKQSHNATEKITGEKR